MNAPEITTLEAAIQFAQAVRLKGSPGMGQFWSDADIRSEWPYMFAVRMQFWWPEKFTTTQKEAILVQYSVLRMGG